MEERSKRSTRFSGDYQKLYKDLEIGSSEDEGGDSEDGGKRRKSSTKKPTSTGKGRTKECPGCGSRLTLSVKQCASCDYQFTSKSMLLANASQQSIEEESQSIREKFPFEPERDEDGSLIVQHILQRRLRHMRNRWSRQSGRTAQELTEMSASEAKFEYEYLIKFKGLSYRHVQWLTASDIDAMNKKSKQMLQRYLTKLDSTRVDGEFAETEFDASNLEVEKILDVREEEVSEIVDHIEEVSDKADDVKTDKSSLKSVDSTNSMQDIESKEATGIERRSSKAVSENDDDLPDSKKKLLNHPERCRRILDKLCEDPYASSFIDPVDTDEYEDYLDVIEEPMCLNDVREKLDSGSYNKYQQYRQFAKDIRLIWDNCKNYNLYKSQIWHTAHVMSLLFERLYQAWLVMFVEMPLPMDDPLAQPWCSTCRVCLADNNDDKMILCDHCDAAFHIYCLRPQLPKVPDGSWTCKRCSAFLASQPTACSFSATVEEEARQVAENANAKKVIRVKKKKYLVKWRGLSYKDCTWETVKDINDDEKIAEFHVLNDNPPDEPPLTQAEIGIELAKDRRNQPMPPIRFPNPILDLNAEVYAQIRSFHFLRWNRIPPDALLKECGPATAALTLRSRRPMLHPRPPAIEASGSSKPIDATNVEAADSRAQNPNNGNLDSLMWLEPIHQVSSPIFEEVADVMGSMIHCVSRASRMDPYPTRPKLPYPVAPIAELEVCVNKGKSPLCMRLGNVKTRHVVMGFKPMDNGKRGPAELCGRIKPGDILLAVNNTSVLDYTSNQLAKLISQLQCSYVYLRLLRCAASAFVERLKAHKEASNGSNQATPFDIVNDYFEDFQQYPSRRPFVTRSCYLGVFPVYDKTLSTGVIKWSVETYDEKYASVSGGEFDDELEAAKAYDKLIDSLNKKSPRNFTEEGELSGDAKALFNMVNEERASNSQLHSELLADTANISDDSKEEPVDEKDAADCKEGNEEVVEDFQSIDSRDSDSQLSSSDDSSDSEDEGSEMEWDSDDSEADYKPTKVREVVEVGNGAVSRLLRAVIQTDYPPNRQEWSNFIFEMGTQKWASGGGSGTGTVVKSSSRIDQMDLASGFVIDTWDSINAASRQLGIPSAAISNCLMGKSDDAGGFKWRMSSLASSTQHDEDDDDKEEPTDEKKEEVWKSKLHTETKEYRNGGTLRDYQLNGLNWLLRCWYSKRSSILADEMGLGKTVQVVSFLDHLFDVENIKGPFLVCVPLSTIEHWKRETEGWSKMNVCLYHDIGGGRDMRDVIREYEWYYSNRSRRCLKFHVLITTFDDLIKDYEELAEVPWRVVVVDEAHRLRNANSKLIECMRSVVAKGLGAFGYQHRILMTGTPLQNNTAELFSLLNFIEPAKFPDAEKFNQRFGVIQTQEQVEALQRRIAPHLLRRVKEDVAKDIPPKEETIIDVELTTMQKQFYRAIYERNLGFLMQSLKSGSLPKLMNIQMELRKCCNHPFLIQGVEDTEMERLDTEMLEQAPNPKSLHKKFDKKAFEGRRMQDFLIPQSGKMVLLDKLLPKLRKEDHKVLIFSQMVKMIDLIEEFCEFRGYSVERLDGRVSGNDRQKAIDRFNRDKNSFVFLLSTRAGGVGINLTAADTVIIFDSDWNPQNDVQAMARCHRIGQSKRVTIYRLITRRSFEAEMFEKASKKLGLEQAVLGSRQFNDQDIEDSQKANVKMDAKEMEQLLREGAYAVMLDDEEESKAFYNQDIDSILEQRTHVLVSEAAPSTDTWLNKANVTASKKGRARKSNFTGETAMEHAEIDVNDPDFWKKVLPDLVTPEMMRQRLTNDSLYDETGDVDREAVEKYMKDLNQMMEGMLDLKRRGNLPDRERDICMNLLLKMSVNEEIFEEDERIQAQEWYTSVEGSRKRGGRGDGTRTDPSTPASAKRGYRKGKLDSPKASSGKRGRGRRSADSDAEFDEGNSDKDEEDDISVDGPKKASKRGRPKGRLNNATLAAAAGVAYVPAKGAKKGIPKSNKRKLAAVDDADAFDDEADAIVEDRRPLQPKKRAKASAIYTEEEKGDEAVGFSDKKQPKSSNSGKSSSSKSRGGNGSARKAPARAPHQSNSDDDEDVMDADESTSVIDESSPPPPSKPAASGKRERKPRSDTKATPAAESGLRGNRRETSITKSGRVTKKLTYYEDSDGDRVAEADDASSDASAPVSRSSRSRDKGIRSPESRRLRESFMSVAERSEVVDDDVNAAAEETCL